MERRFAAGGAVEELAEFGDVLRFERIAAGTEQIERPPVHKEDGFLTFVNNQLCQDC